MDSRIESHKIEEKTINIIENKIMNYEGRYTMMYRKILGRDYGVDGLVELFENDNPTGMIAYVQVKGTKREIEPLKRTKEIAVNNVSESCLKYASQDNIPLLLFYVSIQKGSPIYFVLLQEILSKNKSMLIDNKDKYRIKIPLENIIYEDLSSIVDIICSYFMKYSHND